MTSAASPGSKLRVVVCGTSFGRFYLRAVRSLAPSFDLVGILARGSDHSHSCAADYDVPLFTSATGLPDNVDVACVAVPAGVAGGRGAELAQELLARGIHVLQEHPLHHDELAECLRQARRHNVQYQLNSFYEHLRPIRRFLDAAYELRRRQQPLFIDAASGSQVLYPLLDILGRTVGGIRPWRFDVPSPISAAVRDLASNSAPYRSLHGVLGGVPVTLRVQNQIDVANPDNHSHFLHRVAVGCEGGVLTLADTHGPVLWQPRLHANRAADTRLLIDGAGTERLDVPSTSVLGSAASPTFREAFTDLWPDAIAHALLRLRAAIEADADPMRTGEYDLTICRIWQDLMTRLGEPELVRLAEPTPLPLPDFVRDPIEQTHEQTDAPGASR